MGYLVQWKDKVDGEWKDEWIKRPYHRKLKSAIQAMNEEYDMEASTDDHAMHRVIDVRTDKVIAMLVPNKFIKHQYAD